MGVVGVNGSETLVVAGILVSWVVVQVWVLPRFGVGT